MFSIREEKPEDVTAIRLVNECAFGQSEEANVIDKLRRKREPNRVFCIKSWFCYVK